MHGWYTYFTDESGNDAYDRIDVRELEETTSSIHELVRQEIEDIRATIIQASSDRIGTTASATADTNDGPGNCVILGGCSQGGTQALHTGLALQSKWNPQALAAVVALRTILLAETPIYGGSLGARRVRIFSAELDDVSVRYQVLQYSTGDQQ